MERSIIDHKIMNNDSDFEIPWNVYFIYIGYTTHFCLSYVFSSSFTAHALIFVTRTATAHVVNCLTI